MSFYEIIYNFNEYEKSTLSLKINATLMILINKQYILCDHFIC